MSVSILKVKNFATGEWKEIPAIVGPTGPAGPQGEEGAQGETGPAGKNAYEYAQEGGYTGTEAEFANELANIKELALQADVDATLDAINEISSLLGNKIPHIDNANVGQVLSVASVDENNAPNSWQTTDLPSGDSYYVDMTPVSETEATPSKTFVEVLEAYKSGKDVRARLNGAIIPLSMNLNDYQLVYTATGGIYSYFISQTRDSDIAQFSITNMATEQYVNDAIANLSIGGGDTLEFIKSITLTEEVSTIKINTDAEGNPLNLKRIIVMVRTIGGTPNEDRSNYWAHPNSINAGAIRIDIAQGVYATGGAVSSVVDIQLIADGVYLLNSSCNNTPKQTWGSYIKESAIKEINLGVSTANYTFGVNTIFYIAGVKV